MLLFGEFNFFDETCLDLLSSDLEILLLLLLLFVSLELLVRGKQILAAVSERVERGAVGDVVPPFVLPLAGDLYGLEFAADADDADAAEQQTQ